MKKLLLTLLLAFMATGLSAQIKYVEGSFKDNASGNVSGTSTDLGVTNLADLAIDWPQKDLDGNRKFDVSLLIIDVENTSAADLDGISAKLSNGLSVIKKEVKNINGRNRLLFFVQPGDPVDITFNSTKFGSDRISGVKLENRHIYSAKLRNATTISVTIDSDPKGAKVFWDGAEKGITPLTIPDVIMGSHNVELIASDTNLADNVKTQTIDFNKENATFYRDMRKKRDVILIVSPADATLKITDADGKLVAQTRTANGEVLLKAIPFGIYAIEGTTPQGDRQKETLTVNAQLPQRNSIRVIGSKAISFNAMQNNTTVTGASVNINGKSEQQTTPLTKDLVYGTYDVMMTYNGYTKSKKLKVDRNSSGEFMIKLPNRRRKGLNPFAIDYIKREWGIAINYVNRSYSFKQDGTSKNYNIWGDEKSMNGVQAGIVYQPYFGYGQGLSTGLYWQAFFTSAGEGSDEFNGQMHTLWIPLEYQFRLPLAQDFSIALNAGAAVEFGISNDVKFKDTDEKINLGFGHNEDYDSYMPKGVSFQWLAGVALQWKALQLEAKMIRGLTDNDDMYTVPEGESKVTCKANSWSVGLSFIF